MDQEKKQQDAYEKFDSKERIKTQRLQREYNRLNKLYKLDM